MVLSFCLTKLDQGLGSTNSTSFIVKCFQTKLNELNFTSGRFFKCGKIDSFAGSEPREFIPFNSGTESNGQAIQTSTNNESIRENNLTQRPDEAAQTSSPATVEEATSTSKQTTSTPTSPSILPTAIEIIEGSGSQASSEQDPAARSADSSTPAVSQQTPRPPSPDYTPSVINPFAFGNSSSGGSIQPYLTRKIGSLEDLRKQEALVGAIDTVKASESEPPVMIPSSSSQLSPTEQGPAGPKVSFLGPEHGGSSQAETERTQGASKRPRIGSTSFHESRPPAKQRAPTPFRTMSDEETDSDSNVETGHKDDRTDTVNSSEPAVETDA